LMKNQAGRITQSEEEAGRKTHEEDAGRTQRKRKPNWKNRAEEPSGK